MNTPDSMSTVRLLTGDRGLDRTPLRPIDDVDQLYWDFQYLAVPRPAFLVSSAHDISARKDYTRSELKFTEGILPPLFAFTREVN